MITRRLLSAVLVVLMNVLFVFILEGQTSKIIYTSTSAEIPNPERGWYSHTQTSYSTFTPLNAESLISNREDNNITLILRLFYLHGLTEQENIPEDYLANMQTDFNTIRSAGVKCIVRYAYSSSEAADIWDASPEIVNSQIESLREVLNSNSDVIAAVQAGFVGVWGEWYYTTNFAGAGYNPSDTDQENRRTLVENLLNILPDHVTVQGRTPAIMRNINETDDPISADEAFSGSLKSRLGHHNDCFMANYSDYGTYKNLEEDLAYLRESTKYTITGGETCDASNDYSNCENSVPRMKELHWTYLNKDYNVAVYNKWKDEGCWDEVNTSLGYRVSLDSAIISDAVEQGASLSFSLQLSNDGYAAPTQYKPIQIVLTHTQTGIDSVLEYSGTNSDIRHWLPGKIRLEGEVSIPVDLTDGNYSMALRFPDMDTGLARNPAYSIQMANAGAWDKEKGTNSLNHIVTIGSGGEGELPSTPLNLYATALSETEINISWTPSSLDEIGFELMRSEDIADNWIHVADIDASSSSYSDNSLTEGTTYYYIIRAKNNYGNSFWSTATYATTDNASSIVEKTSSIIEVFPNVLRDEGLKINFSENTVKNIQITNTSGEIIFNAKTNQTVYEISQDTFHPGMYIIIIKMNRSVYTKKLVVL